MSLGDIIQGPGPPGCGLDARLTTLLCKKKYCFETQTSENRMIQDKSGRILYGRLWFKRADSPMMIEVKCGVRPQYEQLGWHVPQESDFTMISLVV
jgi:hypothetical protein